MARRREKRLEPGEAVTLFLASDDQQMYTPKRKDSAIKGRRGRKKKNSAPGDNCDSHFSLFAESVAPYQ